MRYQQKIISGGASSLVPPREPIFIFILNFQNFHIPTTPFFIYEIALFTTKVGSLVLHFCKVQEGLLEQTSEPFSLGDIALGCDHRPQQIIDIKVHL